MWIEVENRIKQGDYAQYGETTVRVYNKYGRVTYVQVRKWHFWPTSNNSQTIAYRGKYGIPHSIMMDAIRVAYYSRGGSAYIQI